MTPPLPGSLAGSAVAVVVWLAAWFASPPAPAVAAQATPTTASGQAVPPSFGAQAAAITVDVVVLDEKGQPVRGLTKADFTVLEDGRPQTLVGFEAREPGAGASASEESPQAATGSGATNEGQAPRPERVLALLVDDLGISAAVMGQVRAALAAWLERHARPRDEITILTTSGDVWWSDTVDRGREDLLLVLSRVKGKALASATGEAMSDLEAYRIAAFESATEGIVPAAARSRPIDDVGTLGGGSKFTGATVMDRVAQRWWDAHYCGPCTDPNEPPNDCREMRVCRQRVASRAQELHQAWTRRAATVYASVARLSRSLASAPGRKSILLVSEQLFEDTTLTAPVREAVDASQRGNTVLYFLGARGLVGSSLNVAENPNAPARPQDVGQMSMEQAFVATGAGESLADETGGVAITSSNDLATGLARMAADSSVYYLLGYQPQELPDGKWHKLEVKLARPGLTVRARKRYLAARPEDAARAAAAEGKRKEPGRKEGGAAGKRPLSPVLLAGSAREGLPLRLASYVQDTNDQGLARVQVVIEIDNSRVQVDRGATPWRATLDLTIMAASLSRAPLVPIDERLQLSLEPGQVASGWWLVPRELWLPPGVSQIRVLARDTASGATGLVSERLIVPDVDQPYLSTPMITDRTLPPLRPGDPPRLVPTAHRVFGRRGPLVCQFEVFVFGGRNLPGLAKLSASHTLQRVGGEVVASSEETPIETDSRHAVRRITLPVEKLEAGRYELTVTVKDALAQRTLRARGSFVIEAPPVDAAGAPS